MSVGLRVLEHIFDFNKGSIYHAREPSHLGINQPSINVVYDGIDPN